MAPSPWTRGRELLQAGLNGENSRASSVIESSHLNSSQRSTDPWWGLWRCTERNPGRLQLPTSTPWKQRKCECWDGPTEWRCMIDYGARIFGWPLVSRPCLVKSARHAWGGTVTFEGLTPAQLLGLRSICAFPDPNPSGGRKPDGRMLFTGTWGPLDWHQTPDHTTGDYGEGLSTVRTLALLRELTPSKWWIQLVLPFENFINGLDSVPFTMWPKGFV